MTALTYHVYQLMSPPAEPQAPGDYLSTFNVLSRNEDYRKTDYPENVYCLTALPQPLTDEVERDGWTECYCTGWFKQKVLSTPGFPSRIARPQRIMYEMREVAGRGQGLFATEDIPAGTLVIAERPLLIAMVWSVGVQHDGMSREEVTRGVSGCTPREL